MDDDTGHDDTRGRTDAAPPPADVVADDEQRPIGALVVTGFLTVTILVFWFGMFALNLSRS